MTTCLTAGSLFTGVAGLDLAAAQVLGTEPVWFCDNDAAAGRVLAHRFPGVPNLGDITTVDWDTVPPVAVLTGGFPCQDLSSAGRQAGLMPGTRSGLWWLMATAIRHLRPRVVVIENVRNLLNAKAHHPAHRDLEPCPWCLADRPDRPVLRALGAVLGDLADLGYDAVWHGVRAADVGSCHERFRVFLLAIDQRTDPADLAAHATGQRRGQGRTEPTGQQWGPDAALRGGAVATHADRLGPAWGRDARDGWAGPADGGRAAAAHAESAGLEGSGASGRPAGRAAADSYCGRQRADQHDLPGRPADVGGGDLDWGVYTTAVRRWAHVLGRPAPTPRVTGPRGGLKLNPALCEWMQGFPAGWFTDVPGIGVNDALRLAGNSVNPYQATAALRWCVAAFGSSHQQ